MCTLVKRKFSDPDENAMKFMCCLDDINNKLSQ